MGLVKSAWGFTGAIFLSSRKNSPNSSTPQSGKFICIYLRQRFQIHRRFLPAAENANPESSNIANLNFRKYSDEVGVKAEIKKAAIERLF